MTEQYQLIVVRGGPGGYAAALQASARGLNALLIEKGQLGGTCLNEGCIPTKSFFYSAYLYHKLKEAESHGITAEKVEVDFSRVQARKQQVVSQLVNGVQDLLKQAGVTVWKGKARALPGPGKSLEVELSQGGRKTVSGENLILATGSQEIIPQVAGADLPGIMSSREALNLNFLPASLAVIGGGVIAVEMASIFAAFGVEVTLIQRSRILRREDQEMVKRLSLYLRRQGIKIITQAPIEEIKEEPEGYRVKAQGRKGEEEIFAEKILMAVGRQPYFGDLDLPALPVDYDQSGLVVDPCMETSSPGIYAVGDAAAPGYFTAHTAYHQGIVAAENAAGQKAYFEAEAVPYCVFTSPQLARTGMTEEEAREKGYSIKTSKFPFSANGKAVIQGEGDGIVKIVGEAPTGKVLGMHILGPQASDLIQEGTLAVAAGCSVANLAQLIHPHPTLSETVWEAALSFTGHSLHMKGI